MPGGDASGADGEVLLDIEVAGALSPGAHVVVYFAPNTDAGFVDAASLRITVTAAAGDDGSSDGARDRRDHAEFPASSPHVLACGGTSPRAVSGIVTSETVWNNGAGAGATWGGVSEAFAVPSWHRAAGVPASSRGTADRGVSDVAAVADPTTGYEVLVDGEKKIYGGTSAMAPLWAALVERLAPSTGRPLRLLHPRLCGMASSAPKQSGSDSTGFRDITVGNSGSFSAGPGGDACTGLGVPDGKALLAALMQSDATRIG